MSARRVIGVAVAVLACAVAVQPAVADPVPGATYTGRAADGGGVSFTVSSDGTLVTSYKIIGVYENGCAFYAEGDYGVWPGAPIDGNTFDYELGSSISFQGAFPGAQSASGTFELQNPASSSSPACDTGAVSWTATTTSTPPPGGSGGGPGGTGAGQGGQGGSHKFTTRVTLRKASAKRLAGRVTSTNGACRAGRWVYLWRGSRRIASTKTKSGGKFSFSVTALDAGRSVRASAPSRTVHAGDCAAGSSTFIKG